MMRHFAWVLALVLLSLSGQVAAQPSDAAVAAARELASSGAEAHLAGEHEVAIDKLSRAYEVVQVPTIAFYLGSSLEAVGRWVEAAERYREVELMPLPDTKPEVHEDAKARARERLEALAPRIPTLAITVTGAGADAAEVFVDGTPIPAVVLSTAIPVDPGERTVVARSGEREETQSVTAREGEAATVELKLPAPPPEQPVAAPAPAPEVTPPPPPTPATLDPPSTSLAPLGWSAIALGGAGSVMAVVAGAITLSVDGTLSDRCVDGVCPPSLADDVDTFNTSRVLTTVGIVAGVVGFGVGIPILLLDEGGEVALRVEPTHTELRVRF